LNKRLLALFFVSVIDILGFGILIPLVPYMGRAFGVPAQWITPILGAYSLFQFLSAPFWGRLSDRYGRRVILVTSLAGACASYVMLGLATNVWWLVASRILGGFMAGNIAAAFAYASDVSEPRNRAASLGMIGAAIGIGFTIGPAVGGVLAGNDVSTANFVRPATVSACLSVLAIALVVFVLPESTSKEQRQQHGARSRSTALRLLLDRPSLRFVACAALLVTCSQSILESIFAIWALNKFGFGPRTVGLLLFCFASLAVLPQGGLVRVLVPRLGEPRLATLGIIAYVLGLVLVGEAPSWGVTAAGLALCGIGTGSFSPSASALASRQSSDHDRGAVMGTYQSSSSLARVIGPFISGPVYAALGASAPYLLGALIAAPAMWFVWRVRDQSSISVSKIDTA
jgi:MFS transporter, DHA1 family, tetracycline resistance protein